MAIHPLNDRLKVKVDTVEFEALKDQKTNSETGIVVETPEELLYLSFHSFAFEESLADGKRLEVIMGLYEKLMGKRIYWEKLQDSGRHIIEENGDEYVFLQMTDVLAYADDVEDKAEVVDSLSNHGSFNLQ